MDHGKLREISKIFPEQNQIIGEPSQEIDGESLNLVTGLSLGLSPESPNQNLCL